MMAKGHAIPKQSKKARALDDRRARELVRDMAHDIARYDARYGARRRA